MRRRGESGYTLIFVALGLTVLMLMAGLGVDVGFLRFERRLEQTAADSAAIAGAAELNYGDVTQAARTDAATNGYTHGSNNVTVTVYNPPNDGPHTGQAGYVEVLVTRTQPMFFAAVGGISTASVTARAVAYGAASNANCVYALASAGTGILMNGAPALITQCGVIV